MNKVIIYNASETRNWAEAVNEVGMLLSYISNPKTGLYTINTPDEPPVVVSKIYTKENKHSTSFTVQP